ncbi:MAG: hypothetical protein ACK4N5_01145 [Myxococcales bacterium]
MRYLFALFLFCVGLMTACDQRQQTARFCPLDRASAEKACEPPGH